MLNIDQLSDQLCTKPYISRGEKDNIYGNLIFVGVQNSPSRIWIDGNKGVLHASAHSHSSDKESNPDWPFAKRLDVGVDNFNFTPISFDKFLEIMNTKTHIST